MAALRPSGIVQVQQKAHVCPNGGTGGSSIRFERSAQEEELTRLMMAYVNTTRVAKPSVADRMAGLFAGFSAMVQRRRIYGQTLRELRALTDRELSDLGMHRSAISDIAREAAYGK